MKTHAFRLHRGQDIYKELVGYAKENHIEAATVLSAVGCVTVGRVRPAWAEGFVAIPEKLEVVSLMGTVSKNRTHLHISLSNNDTTTFGGHMEEGCLVNTTCEVVLLELDDVTFSDEFDPETGYGELVITKK
ncbi:DNA-binding protein [Hydrogenoanaerobacterium sp.]|uniref:PPC domain-containing DNA-binding protein n=1 Tax=Hydrogenoanaerobacterium sp. TaxID=2953763 RepID=UPI002898E3C0|nr:DNA-binding protein [Hydrogenoanaerobacterium sp.]